MMDQMNLDLLSQLFAQIERAWFDDHDRTLVHRLSEQHPEFREQLYEFFEDIVVEPERQPSRESLEAEKRVSEWLLSSGFDIGIGAAAQSRSSTTTSTDHTGAAPLSRNLSALPVINPDLHQTKQLKIGWFSCDGVLNKRFRG